MFVFFTETMSEAEEKTSVPSDEDDEELALLREAALRSKRPILPASPVQVPVPVVDSSVRNAESTQQPLQPLVNNRDSYAPSEMLAHHRYPQPQFARGMSRFPGGRMNFARAPRSNLIVIQTVPMEGDCPTAPPPRRVGSRQQQQRQPASEALSGPSLLRPQDRWEASGKVSNVQAKPKASTKFTRYDDSASSDSDEHDDDDETSDESSATDGEGEVTSAFALSSTDSVIDSAVALSTPVDDIITSATCRYTDGDDANCKANVSEDQMVHEGSPTVPDEQHEASPGDRQSKSVCSQSSTSGSDFESMSPIRSPLRLEPSECRERISASRTHRLASPVTSDGTHCQSLPCAEDDHISDKDNCKSRSRLASCSPPSLSGRGSPQKDAAEHFSSEISCITARSPSQSPVRDNNDVSSTDKLKSPLLSGSSSSLHTRTSREKSLERSRSRSAERQSSRLSELKSLSPFRPQNLHDRSGSNSPSDAAPGLLQQHELSQSIISETLQNACLERRPVSARAGLSHSPVQTVSPHLRGVCSRTNSPSGSVSPFRRDRARSRSPDGHSRFQAHSPQSRSPYSRPTFRSSVRSRSSSLDTTSQSPYRSPLRLRSPSVGRRQRSPSVEKVHRFRKRSVERRSASVENRLRSLSKERVFRSRSRSTEGVSMSHLQPEGRKMRSRSRSMRRRSRSRSQSIDRLHRSGSYSRRNRPLAELQTLERKDRLRSPPRRSPPKQRLTRSRSWSRERVCKSSQSSLERRRSSMSQSPERRLRSQGDGNMPGFREHLFMRNMRSRSGSSKRSSSRSVERFRRSKSRSLERNQRMSHSRSKSPQLRSVDRKQNLRSPSVGRTGKSRESSPWRKSSIYTSVNKSPLRIVNERSNSHRSSKVLHSSSSSRLSPDFNNTRSSYRKSPKQIYDARSPDRSKVSDVKQKAANRMSRERSLSPPVSSLQSHSFSGGRRSCSPFRRSPGRRSPVGKRSPLGRNAVLRSKSRERRPSSEKYQPLLRDKRHVSPERVRQGTSQRRSKTPVRLRTDTSELHQQQVKSRSPQRSKSQSPFPPKVGTVRQQQPSRGSAHSRLQNRTSPRRRRSKSVEKQRRSPVTSVSQSGRLHTNKPLPDLRSRLGGKDGAEYDRTRASKSLKTVGGNSDADETAMQHSLLPSKTGDKREVNYSSANCRTDPHLLPAHFMDSETGANNAVPKKAQTESEVLLARKRKFESIDDKSAQISNRMSHDEAQKKMRRMSSEDLGEPYCVPELTFLESDDHISEEVGDCEKERAAGISEAFECENTINDDLRKGMSDISSSSSSKSSLSDLSDDGEDDNNYGEQLREKRFTERSNFNLPRKVSHSASAQPLQQHPSRHQRHRRSRAQLGKPLASDETVKAASRVSLQSVLKIPDERVMPDSRRFGKEVSEMPKKKLKTSEAPSVGADCQDLPVSSRDSQKLENADRQQPARATSPVRIVVSKEVTSDNKQTKPRGSVHSRLGARPSSKVSEDATLLVSEEAGRTKHKTTNNIGDLRDRLRGIEVAEDVGLIRQSDVTNMGRRNNRPGSGWHRRRRSKANNNSSGALRYS